MKFTHEGGIAVRVRAKNSKSGESILDIEVEDSGIGISEEDMKSLFTPFQQSSNTPSPEGGTGLGLAISNELIRLMGGEIELKSALGQGSVFRLHVPVEWADQAEVVRRDAPRRVKGLKSGFRGRKILVVDDQVDNRTLLTFLLRTAGFDVVQAANGEEAIKVYAEQTPELEHFNLNCSRTI